MNIPDRQKEEFLLHHQQFLASPIGNQIRKLLEKRVENLVNFMADKSISDITDQQLRYYAVQLKETKNIIKDIYDQETFLAKSTKL